MNKPKIKSPCISICVMKAKVCIGCGRTDEEIEEWMLLDDEARAKVVEDSKKRLLAMKNPEKPPEATEKDKK